MTRPRVSLGCSYDAVKALASTTPQTYHSEAISSSPFTSYKRHPILQAIIAEAGWPIWPLLFVSVAALAIIFERMLTLRAARVCPPGVGNEAVRMLRSNTLDAQAITKLEDSSAAGRVLATILTHRNLSKAELRTVAEETGSDVSHELNRFLPALAMIATIAPLMGLFGTVIGMIEIFASYQPGGTDPGQLARGISIALYNTGFGILIAVPAAVAHRLLRVHVNNLLFQVERAARQLIQQLGPR
jgi:biopolymer transport protein ExbB